MITEQTFSSLFGEDLELNLKLSDFFYHFISLWNQIWNKIALPGTGGSGLSTGPLVMPQDIRCWDTFF